MHKCMRVLAVCVFSTGRISRLKSLQRDHLCRRHRRFLGPNIFSNVRLISIVQSMAGNGIRTGARLNRVRACAGSKHRLRRVGEMVEQVKKKKKDSV